VECIQKSQSISLSGEYIPRGRTALHTILEKHFKDFVENYEVKYAEECGKYSLERIISVVDEYLKCGDFKQGIARVKCTNPECNHDFFVPFSCKQFLFCPGCSQKRTLLFGEYVTDEVLLRLPHKFFTFTLPKALRIFLRNDKYLFSELSKLIYTLIEDFYTEAAGQKILSGGCLVYQSFGDMMRFNSHWHGIILEGGFDSQGNFVFIPIHSMDKMTECFRRRVIRFFLDRELITKSFASNLLSWKNSGFSIDAKLRLYGSDDKTRESIAQYLVRPPLSLNKIKYEPFKGKVLFKTKYNEYFGENFKVYTGGDFIAALTKHIPPARIHLVRYYGLYSSRGRGIWKNMPYVVRLAPEGWVKKQEEQEEDVVEVEVEVEGQDVKGSAKRSAWARLINKVYGINPLICEKCGSDMSIVAFIIDSEQIERIMQHLKKQSRAPPITIQSSTI
jgi:hypothetical protein